MVIEAPSDLLYYGHNRVGPRSNSGDMVQGAQHQETGNGGIHIGKATSLLVFNGLGSHQPLGLGGEGPGLYLFLSMVSIGSRHPGGSIRQD